MKNASRLINWHSAKLIVIWIVAITFLELRELSPDEAYASMMTATPFLSVSVILIVLAMVERITNVSFWLLAGSLWLAAINIYTWVTPLSLDLQTWHIFGVLALTVSSITTLVDIARSVSTKTSLSVD